MEKAPNTSFYPSGLKDCSIEDAKSKLETFIGDYESVYGRNESDALTALRSYIAKIPYDIITKEDWEDKEKRESFYKLHIYGVLPAQRHCRYRSQEHPWSCRCCNKDRHRHLCAELKVDDSVENALAQIDGKGYTIPYEAEGRTLTKCGVCISSEQRNITHWRAVDIEGNVIDEQKF